MLKIAVIVPVFGYNPKQLPFLLEALAKQRLDGDWELILVDNNSCSEDTQLIQECVESYRFQINIKLLEEKDQQSSYAARNKGISAAAEAKYLVFTDADCRPAENWLQSGISCLKENEADLAGGRVCFTFSNPPSGAEIVDSFTNLQIESDVSQGFAKTANLFVKKSIFDEMGLFNPKKISGEDVCWTKGASEAGYKLAYASDAVVYHPARSWIGMVRKQFRVGTNKSAVMHQLGISSSALTKRTFMSLLPPSWNRVRKKFPVHTEREIVNKKYSILLAVWVSRAATALGQLIKALRLI